MHHEHVAFYGDASIQEVANAGSIRWAGHFARMPDNIPAKLVIMNRYFTILSLL